MEKKKIKEKINNFKNKGEIKEIKEIKEVPGCLDSDKFSSEKNLSRKFFFEFLGESEDFVTNYHRHLSENSEK